MTEEVWETIAWDNTGKLLAQRKAGEWNVYRIVENGKTVARYKKKSDVLEALRRRVS